MQDNVSIPKELLEKTIAKGVDFLSEIIPLEKSLFFPLIYEVILWAVKRPGEWRKKIFSWEVWPDPDYVKAKSDEFIVYFFSSRPEIRAAFRIELDEENMSCLRNMFSCLYPVVGLEDPFLMALFRDELEKHDFPKIVEDFFSRVSSARNVIAEARGSPRFLEWIVSLGREAASLAGYLAGRDDIQDMVLEKVKKRTSK